MSFTIKVISSIYSPPNQVHILVAPEHMNPDTIKEILLEGLTSINSGMWSEVMWDGSTEEISKDTEIDRHLSEVMD